MSKLIFILCALAFISGCIYPDMIRYEPKEKPSQYSALPIEENEYGKPDRKTIGN